MSGESGNAGKAGSRRGHGKKAPTPKPRKPSRTLKGTSMAKKAPPKKPALRPVPAGVTNAVHGGTPAKPKRVGAKHASPPIPAGATVITHGAKLRKPTKPPPYQVPGPGLHIMGPAPKPAPKTKKLVAGPPLVYIAPEAHDAGATPVTYVPENVKWPGGFPKQAGDVGTYHVMRTITSPQQMAAAHQATVPQGMTLANPMDTIGAHSHKFVVPSRFVNPFWSHPPGPYDPEDVGAKTPLPKDYWNRLLELQGIWWINTAARLIGPPDQDLIPYPADTEVQP